MRFNLTLFLFLSWTFINAQPGNIDLGFNPQNVPQHVVFALAVQSDGKVLVGGSETPAVSSKLERYNPDGSKDAGFATGTASKYIFYTEMQPGNKILVSGDFTAYNGTSIRNVVRLESNGLVDGSFNAGSFGNGGAWTSFTDPNGKILIGGDYTGHAGSRNYLTRLNSNGTPDNTFNTGTGPDAPVYSLARYPDGKILVGGYFTSYNGVSRNRIMRLNADGSLDLSFNPGTGANDRVYQVIIQPDQKIIIAGNFTTYNGNSRSRIARLNADGSIDPTFTPGLGANDDIYSAVLEGDGRIVIAGDFTSFNNTPSNRIARLRDNGTPDPSFTMGLGVNGPVYFITAQPDGKIILGGEFTSYNITQRKNVARVLAAVPTALRPVEASLSVQYTYPNPANESIKLVLHSTKAQDIRLLITDIASKEVLAVTKKVKTGKNEFSLSVAHLAAGSYFIMGVTSYGETGSIPFVKN